MLPFSPGGPTLPGRPGAPFSPFSPASPINIKRKKKKNHIKKKKKELFSIGVSDKSVIFRAENTNLLKREKIKTSETYLESSEAQRIDFPARNVDTDKTKVNKLLNPQGSSQHYNDNTTI